MKKNLEDIRRSVRDLIADKTENLSDLEYLNVLEEVQADVDALIDCKKEEMNA